MAKVSYSRQITCDDIVKKLGISIASTDIFMKHTADGIEIEFLKYTPTAQDLAKLDALFGGGKGMERK